MRSLPRNLMGPAWDFGSAAPSLNLMVAACGLPTTLRAAQASTSPCLSKPRRTNDACSAVLEPSYQSIIARSLPERYLATMATQAKAKLVAIVDDDELMRGALQGLLKAVGLPSRAFASAEEFLKSGQQHQTACLIADIRMPGMSGLELQTQLNAEHCRIPTIFITAHGDTKMRLQALRAGAVEFMAKPFDDEVLLENVQQLSYERRFEQVIGNSPALEEVLEQVERVAPTDSTVLIQGETGTGKELIAHAIHNISSRCGRPFVRLNCAAIPLDLLESELFGHEKGAFTGAIAQKIGRFELADKGTLFLDEVADIPLELQPKLLRVLQEQEFERLGSTRTRHVDVRVVAATNSDLARMVEKGAFRSDLFYRLNVFPLAVPPLRERREDIATLV